MKRFYEIYTKNLLLSLFMVFLSLVSFSATFYVSNTGNDANSGLTTSLAWKTLAKVNAATVKAGDQILFQRSNTFYGSIIVKNSGTSGNVVTYGAYGTGANPIITGFTTVTAWTNLGGNIWESTNVVSTLSTCNMVSINGINTAMGRYPNSTATWGGYLPFQSHSGTTSISSTSLTGTPDWTGAEVVIRANRFILTRSTVTSQSSGTLNYATSVNEPTNNYGFFIQNDTRTLDAQNEWYYNPTTHKIQIYSTMEPTDVKVSSIDKLFTFNNSLSYITIENISFTGANSFAIYEPFSAVNHLTIQNCDISFSGNGAIKLVGNNCWLENNNISYSNNNAVDLTNSQRITFKSNTIQNSGELAGMGVTGNGNYMAIVAINKLTYGVIENNRIINTGFNGMYFYGDSITIKNNFIDTFCNVLDDGGGIYTYTGGRAAMANMKILSNIIINGTAAIDGRLDNTDLNCGGIYMDDNSANIEVGNNSIYNCNNIGIVLRNANNINLHDNISFDNDYAQIHTWDDANGGSTENNIITGNKFFAKSNSQYAAIFKSSTNNLENIGVLDNNNYTRPIRDLKTIYISQITNHDTVDISGWQSFSNQDANSQKSTVPVSNINDIQFDYNATISEKTINLSLPMIDVKGTKYTPSVTLQPFTSVVLMKDNNLVTVSGAPTSVRATAGNTSASVSFVAPVSNGGSSITGYTVTSVPAGGIDSNAGTTSLNHTITGLTNGISYTFTVEATNSVGNSVGSAASNSIIPIDDLITKQAEILPTHFIPVWQGENGFNHMNIMVISASLEDLPLSAADEIAVFDGSICVGSMKLSVPINSADNTTFLTISASQNDGSNNGFTDNDTIIIKIWDNLNQKEMVANSVTYRNEISSWITSGKYTAGATSVVELISFVEYSQSIELVKGYNLISSYVTAPDPDVSVVTQTLCEQGSLVKIQDEAGNTFENWGSFGGWINNVGSIENTEGYKIKVANDCALQITGRPIALPLDIPLKTGWNIISFPRTDLVDAMSIIQPLIDHNTLIKVQDELGNSIENWGIFGGWKNSIGFFLPGKAYKVKINADAVLMIQENYIKSALILAKTEKTEYFSSDIKGNGTDHMNINVVGLREAGISVGDELAAFDGKNCVGTLKITENHLIDGTAAIVASFSSDEQNPDGFTVGDKIQLVVWNKLNRNEFQVELDVLNGHAEYAKNSSVLVRLKSITTKVSSLDDLMKIDVFPNPSNGKFTVRFSNLPDVGSKLDIMDISGRKIVTRMITRMNEEFNLDHQSSGIYMVKSVINSKETIHKLIVN